ncbi:MAG: hypothetical protein COV73_03550, partial [Candidatus Omnitrophica bacterium CG11_big_fil_rev_8_21_14_0_20_43_6]
TRGSGLHCSFLFDENWHDLTSCDWQVKKISEKEMVLTFDCQSLALSQIWLLNYSKEDSLNIKVEAKLKKDLVLKERFLGLQLNDEYKSWHTCYEKGDFLNERYINNIAPTRLKDSKVAQVVLNPQNNNFQKVSFKSKNAIDTTILSIYKRNLGQEASVNLDFSSIIPESRASLAVGYYPCFEAEITLGKDTVDIEKPVLATEVGILGVDLKLVFDRGKGRIFWKHKELTEGLSLYTSVCQGGIWYDSYQAVWSINKIQERYLEVRGDWPYVPISQIWQIQLLNDNLFEWKVEIDIHQAVSLEIMQANLMLSSEYKNWLFPDNRIPCIFLDEYTQNYDILPFRFWYGKPTRAGLTVTGRGLPQIQFSLQSKDEFTRGVIENTDYLYSARLLQYQKSGVNKLFPGRYPYFEGAIKINGK